MKRSFLILSILLMPLTLASETQNRFRICILVDGEDTHISNVLEIHLKREFRLLGDVDIVELDENWRFILSIKYIEIEFKDRRKTGSVALADVFNQRLPASFFGGSLSCRIETTGSSCCPGVAYYHTDNLEKYCIWLVGIIDKSDLTPMRR